MPHLQLLCDINELSWIFTDSKDLDGFLQKIVAMAATHMKTEVCSIYLYDEATEMLTLTATQGLHPDSIGKVKLKLGEGLTGIALKEMRPVCEKDARRHPNFRYFPGTDEERYKSFLAVPIFRGPSKIGVLAVQRERGGFSRKNKEIQALEAVASQLANIIENTHVLMSLRRAGEASALSPAATPVPARPAISQYLKGQTASEGFALAHAAIFDRERSLRALAKEKFRPYAREDFEHAVERTESQLRDLQAHVEERLTDAASLIFTAHLLMLKDSSFTGAMRQRIEEGANPPAAILEIAQKYVDFFHQSANAYIREKAQDVEDLAVRLVGNLAQDDSFTAACQDCIVVARDLYPSDVLKFASEKARGIILVGGGTTSHIAILARSLRIPMIIVDEPEILLLPPQTRVILDGEFGMVFLNPSREVLERFAAREESRKRLEEQKPHLLPVTQTRDGAKIVLLANINLLSDMKQAAETRCEGIGLYRSEFPFIIRSGFPSEEEQYSVYRKLIEGMKGKPITLRTLDIGGDKVLSYFANAREANPFLGMRSIRFSLQYKDIFRQQLRAMLRAGAGAPLRIMFPMISSVDEFLEARQVVRECIAALHAENTPHHPHPLIGAMVEIPSLLPIIDDLAREADFFSLGTNDLIQYLLAVDRTNEKVAHLYQPHHPAVLRSIQRVAEAAQRRGIEISICGDMAQDERFIPFFIGLGIRALSLDPGFIPKIQKAISETDLVSSRKFAEQLLSYGTVQETFAALHRGSAPPAPAAPAPAAPARPVSTARIQSPSAAAKAAPAAPSKKAPPALASSAPAAPPAANLPPAPPAAPSPPASTPRK